MTLEAWGGAGWDVAADPAPVKYLVAQNGVFRIFTTPVGRFQLPWPGPAPKSIVPADATSPQVTLSVPRIPAVVLALITHRFRDRAPYEHLLNVYWQRSDNRWLIETPAQRATDRQVEVLTPAGWHPRFDPYDPTRPRVLQIHSHGTMAAFFSATDDADEIACGLYAVMGRCESDQPELRVRAGMAGQFLALPLDQVFALSPDAVSQWTPTPRGQDPITAANPNFKDGDVDGPADAGHTLPARP